LNPWDSKKTEETRRIEEALREEFQDVEAYRYNSASIRVRVIDPRFAGKTIGERDAMVDPILNRLPEETQREILLLLTLTPEETTPGTFTRHSLVNLEFEDSSPSLL
jgi:stress-induced morphogen